MVRYDDAADDGRYSYYTSSGIISLRDGIAHCAPNQWPQVLEQPIEIIRPRERCRSNDPASRHCWSAYGFAALDAYFNYDDPSEREEGFRLFQRLRDHAETLGVQGCNYGGLRWGFDPDDDQVADMEIRPITEGDLHFTHLHAELNDAAARSLTTATVIAALGEDDMPFTPEQIRALTAAGSLDALKSEGGHVEIRQAMLDGWERDNGEFSTAFDHAVTRAIERQLGDPDSTLSNRFEQGVARAIFDRLKDYTSGFSKTLDKWRKDHPTTTL